ncbi:FecR domain-containing protein [Pseudomonas xantholysinigenes]|uniref:FecR domain-containing protein n=1 Tax=Pseudomonas xantholysinigenes TaxID=2745490 RepID=A0A9E6TVW2_9PSED|nr:FecR domain-containing protein [Pseudomonas xantholysinigenes]QXI36591.1 FecR domain-containing protein [Pseudomonas xantholysinigenes]
MKTALALILLALIGASALLGSPWMSQGFDLADLRTTAGQQLSRHLDDGTLLVLQANSAVDVKYDAQQRRVTLLEGRLAVDVADDDPRPFLLITEHGTLATHDAQLSLIRLGGETTANLQAGSAELDSAGHHLQLQTGQPVHFDRTGPRTP